MYLNCVSCAKKKKWRCDLKNKIKNLKELLKLGAPAPWYHNCDEDDPDGSIMTEDGCCVAIIQPHGNIRTIQSTGQTFSHNDARLIVEMRNSIEEIIATIDFLDKDKS